MNFDYNSVKGIIVSRINPPSGIRFIIFIPSNVIVDKLIRVGVPAFGWNESDSATMGSAAGI